MKTELFSFCGACGKIKECYAKRTCLLQATMDIKTIKSEKEQRSGIYYPLFKFFSENHNLILLDSEIQEVIHEVNKFNAQNGAVNTSGQPAQ